jgi:aconitate decarboxylase
MASLGAEGGLEIVWNAIKPFPCGIVVHPVIDGCIGLHEQEQLERAVILIDKVKAVSVRVHSLVVELTGKTAPRDGLEGKFSGVEGLLFGKGYAGAV